ncbi:MAG: deoxyguanosinetriphosphate triphosphohydrolase, partial [Clostridium sp.]
MNVREKIEGFEELTFIQQATFSNKSLGRDRYEDEDSIRT